MSFQLSLDVTTDAPLDTPQRPDGAERHYLWVGDTRLLHALRCRCCNKIWTVGSKSPGYLAASADRHVQQCGGRPREPAMKTPKIKRGSGRTERMSPLL